jgi:hypothetical protein
MMLGFSHKGALYSQKERIFYGQNYLYLCGAGRIVGRLVSLTKWLDKNMASAE